MNDKTNTHKNINQILAHAIERKIYEVITIDIGQVGTAVASLETHRVYEWFITPSYAAILKKFKENWEKMTIKYRWDPDIHKEPDTHYIEVSYLGAQIYREIFEGIDFIRWEEGEDKGKPNPYAPDYHNIFNLKYWVSHFITVTLPIIRDIAIKVSASIYTEEEDEDDAIAHIWTPPNDE